MKITLDIEFSERMADKMCGLSLVVFQVVIIILYGTLTKYDREADPVALRINDPLMVTKYPLFQDVHVMIFIGFGFLMTFLKKYGFSSVGFNFLLAACMLEWGILCNGIFSNDYISVGINSLMDADVLAATILISMGAVLGKTTPFQLFAMGIIEAVIYSCNEELIKKLKVIDTGDSLTVHTFGAYFGLACSRVLGKPKYKDMEGSSYQSDIFAMIGTLFLWVFWPSFNGGSVYGDAQQRAVINTYISIAASCVAAFAISSITSRENKFNMVHVQNATLAGGVAVGTAASMVLRPYGAAIVGSVAGILSATGYVYLQPWLDSRLGIHDTCGVHNLHGMPGVLAGFVGAVGAGMASQDTYGQTGLFYLFPAMAPPLFSDEMKAIQMKTIKVLPGDGRSPGVQAGYQILGIVVTLVISVAAGALTGLLLRVITPWTGGVSDLEAYSDSQHWHLEDSEDFVVIRETKKSTKKLEIEEPVLLASANNANFQMETHS